MRAVWCAGAGFGVIATRVGAAPRQSEHWSREPLPCGHALARTAGASGGAAARPNTTGIGR